jgi:hypothetical protein
LRQKPWLLQTPLKGETQTVAALAAVHASEQ